MRAVDIRIGDKEHHDTPLFPELRENEPTEGELMAVGILEGGMTSGLPSLWLIAEILGDGLSTSLLATARRASPLIGGPCWCVSSDEPHEGWVHGPACIVIHEFVASGKFSFQMSFGQWDVINAALTGAMARWNEG